MELRQREPRLVDEKYLRWLRKKPCCVCGKPAPSDACHIRFGSSFYGKRDVGMGEKPDDRWAIPMCRVCHITQHSMNEQEFYRERRILPLLLAQRLYSEFGGDGGKVQTKKRKRTTIIPKGFTGRKIISRPFPRAKRKLKSRGL